MSDEEQKAEERNVGNRPPLPTDAVAGATGHIDAHNRLIEAIEDLRAVQDEKADAAHSHPISNVAGLQAALDGKAPTSHTHPQYLESNEIVAGSNITVDRTTLPGFVIIDSQIGITQATADARYLSATEIVAGNNITVDRSTTPGSVIINGAAGGGGGGLSQAEADERYINVNGDSMTGPLQIAYGSDNAPSLEVRGKTHVIGYLGVGYDWDSVGTISLDDANGDLYISPGFVSSYGDIKLDAGGAPVLLTGLKNPVGASDAANKAYVDGAVAGAAPGGLDQTAADARYLRRVMDKSLPSYTLTDPTNHVVGEFIIHEDASNTVNWPDRFGFRFRSTGGQEVRTGGFNEYGEGRFDAAKTSTIPLRAHGNFLGTHTAPLFECRVKRGGATVFSVAADGSTTTQSSMTAVGNATAKNLTGCIALAVGAALPTGLPDGTVVVRY